MRGVTVQSRQLGRHLRELRKETGVSAVDAAGEIGVSDVTIYRYEAGATVPKPPAVRALCDLYGARGRSRDALVALAREADTPGWWRSFNGAIPKWFEPFMSMEAAAELIRAYDAELVPGLLQTEEYADATFRANQPPPPDREREQQVAARMRRQKVVSRRRPPRLDVVIGEAAVARPLGGAATMTAQLRNLDRLSRLPHVTLRVLPLDGAHCALSAGARFNLLTFPAAGHGGEPPLVYAESLTGSLYLDQPAEIAAYDQVWEGVLPQTLTPDRSRAKINEYVKRYQP